MSFTQILSNLISPIFKVLEWLRSLFNTVWGYFLSFLVILFTPLKWFIDQVNFWVIYLTTQLESLTSKVNEFWSNIDTSYSAVASTLATANMIFPLSHLFYVMSLLFVLWIIAILYRLIKSWVPTVS